MSGERKALMPEQRRAYLLREGNRVSLLIGENQEAVAGLLANGEEIYCLWEDEYEHQEKPKEEPRISFGEMVVLACLIGVVFLWIPVGFLLLRFFG